MMGGMTTAFAPPTTVRPAAITDASLVAALGARTFRDTYRGMMEGRLLEHYIRTHFHSRAISEEMQTPGTAFLVAEAGGAPAGYAVTRLDPPPATVPAGAMRLGRIYVETSAKGRGVGTALLKAVIARGLDGGHPALWLTAWERNTRAIDVYRHWGFVDGGADLFEFAGVVYRDRVMVRPLVQVG